MALLITNAPWVSHEVARGWARRWERRFVTVGAQGHINTESGHGTWPQGLALLEEMFDGVLDGPAAPIQSPCCVDIGALAA